MYAALNIAVAGAVNAAGGTGRVVIRYLVVILGVYKFL